MEGENQRRTLGDYSKPIHEGYRNTIETANMEQELKAMECQVNSLMKEAILFVGRSENLWQSYHEPPRQEKFEGLVTSFIRNKEEEIRQLEEYMNIIGNEFMQMSLKESESLVNSKSLESFGVKAPPSYPNSFPPKQLCVKYVHIILPNPLLVRESTFGFKPDTKNNKNVKFQQDAENSLQVISSFEVYASSVTYPEEVEETIGTPMEVEPLDHTKLEDLGLSTCTH
ncbi:hypothetical protein Tco_0351899 [Tanacetum coccineum]